jgi:hypothetical protein
MPKKFSKLSDVLLGCCGASLGISLVHDPKVIRKPARCARLPQLLFKSVEVGVPCVPYLFSKGATPNGSSSGTAEQVLRSQVVGFARMTILCQRDGSCLTDVANVNRRNTGVAERHRIQSWPNEQVFQSRVVLHEISWAKDGKRHVVVLNRVFYGSFAGKMRNIQEPVRLQDGEVGDVLHTGTSRKPIRGHPLSKFIGDVSNQEEHFVDSIQCFENGRRIGEITQSDLQTLR